LEHQTRTKFLGLAAPMRTNSAQGTYVVLAHQANQHSAFTDQLIQTSEPNSP